MTVEDQADLANAVWAIAVGAEAMEVVAPNVEAVNKAMDDLWKRAPEWSGKGWRRPRSKP